MMNHAGFQGRGDERLGRISRRAVLRMAAVAGALGAMRRAMAEPTGSGTSMTLGFSTYGLRALTTEQAIRAVAQIGYDSVEITVFEGWDADPAGLSGERRKAIGRELRESRLQLTSLMENLPLSADDAKHRAGLERLKLAAELGHALSPERPPVVETILGGKGEWAKAKALFVKRLADWRKLGESTRTVIAVKPHLMHALNLPGDAAGLMKELGDSPWLRIVYDYSHYVTRGVSIEESVKTLLPFTAMVAVKDVTIENGQPVFVLPGETGKIDYAALLRCLMAGGYRGEVSCEVPSSVWKKAGYDGVEAARKCYERMSGAFAAAGVKR